MSTTTRWPSLRVHRGPARCSARGVHEHVLATAVAHDKAEPLGRVVPLDRALLLRGRDERRLIAVPAAAASTAARTRARTRRTRRRRRRAVDVEHLGHLRWAALARRHANLERLARLDLLNPESGRGRSRAKNASPLAIRQLDKAKTAIAAEPLHHRFDRRAGRLLLITAGPPYSAALSCNRRRHSRRPRRQNPGRRRHHRRRQNRRQSRAADPDRDALSRFPRISS